MCVCWGRFTTAVAPSVRQLARRFEGGGMISPRTGLLLPTKHVTPNFALRSAMEQWCQRLYVRAGGIMWRNTVLCVPASGGGAVMWKTVVCARTSMFRSSGW